jgi:hypothetical protein
MNTTLAYINSFASIIATILSVGVLTLILKLSTQIKDIQDERIQIAKDKASVTEERLRLAEDELKRLEKINDGVTKIGASLGIEEFQKALQPGVNIRDIGDNFSGKIAGRDINEFMNDIGQLIDKSNNDIKNYVEESTKYMDATTNILTQQDVPGAYQYALTFLYSWGDKLRDDFQKTLIEYAEKGWSFYGLTAEYRGEGGYVLVFRRSRGTESFHEIQSLKMLQKMISNIGK